MPLAFTGYDWAVLGGYVALLALAAWWSTRARIAKADDYFLASHHAPTWLVAVSVFRRCSRRQPFWAHPTIVFAAITAI